MEGFLDDTDFPPGSLPERRSFTVIPNISASLTKIGLQEHGLFLHIHQSQMEKYRPILLFSLTKLAFINKPA